MAETLTMDYNREHNLEVCITKGEGALCFRGADITSHAMPQVRIVRIFNTYGPHMALDDGRVVSNFVAQALRGEPLTVYGDGSQTRSFQFVSDLIKGLVAVMDQASHSRGDGKIPHPEPDRLALLLGRTPGPLQPGQPRRVHHDRAGQSRQGARQPGLEDRLPREHLGRPVAPQGLCSDFRRRPGCLF